MQLLDDQLINGVLNIGRRAGGEQLNGGDKRFVYVFWIGKTAPSGVWVEINDVVMALPVLLEPVRSTMVNKLGYLSGQQTLFVEFHNESVYAYFGVSPLHYGNLQRTNSVGRYLNKHILRKYPSARITAGASKQAKEAA